MNINQKLLVSLLSHAIHGRVYNDYIDESTDWKDILLEAKGHHVAAIIYQTIQALDVCKRPNETVMQEWNNIAIIQAISQIQQINNIKTILNNFCDSGIPIVLLKGLVLRNLYPKPEFRTMIDADILVHIEDIEKAKAILISNGYYYKNEHDSKEIHFFKKNCISIELHWKLTNEGYIKNSMKFEKEIWKNSVETLFEGINASELSADDLLLHQCMHMLFHIKNDGFGLRLLCDFVLTVESKRELINWSYFTERIMYYKMEKFVIAIFLVCRKLFGLVLPERFDITGEEYETNINTLIDDIFISGHFSNNSPERKRINELIKNDGYQGDSFIHNKAVLYLKIIFPSWKGLKNLYPYLHKHPFLYPIAWIHRLLTNIFNKDIVNNIQFRFRFSRETNNDFIKRAELLKWLGIR